MKTILSQMPDWASFMRGQDTLRIGYPWIALGAILALERLLQPMWRVLELGSGGSTVFWAKRCAAVQSLETDAEWARHVTAAVAGMGQATVTHCPTVAVMAQYVSAVPAASVDVLVVDHGDPERHALRKNPNRLPLAIAAVHTLKVGGWLVVDNYACFGMQRFDWSAFAVWTFDEPGRVPGGRAYSGHGTRLGQRMAA